MPPPADKTITVTIDGVTHTIDMNKINELYAAIAAAPGESPGENLAMSMTANPLVTAGDEVPPDSDDQGDGDADDMARPAEDAPINR